MDVLERSGLRPVHYTYVVNDRRAPDFFFRAVIGATVWRHLEIRLPTESECPDVFDGRMSKTFFGFGPEATHFCIQMVYYYRDVGARLGNSLECLKLHSLRAIARSKAVGLPLTKIDDNSFDFISPNGVNIRLVDDAHRRCDPIFETSYRTNQFEESEYFWTQIMGVDIISKTAEDFVLFFGNHKLLVRYVKFEGEIAHSDFFQLCFTLPERQLLNLAKNIPEKYVVTPLRRLSYPERDADFMLTLTDPNGYHMAFHDVESWSKIAKPDPKAATRLDLSLNNEARYRAMENAESPSNIG